MNLNTQRWKNFYLKNLYKIIMGNKFDKNKMTEDEPTVNFVSRISYNNGVDGKVDYVEGIEPFRAGLVTVALGGSYLGSCFVQEESFYTGQNVAVMEAVASEMTHDVNLFISGLVRYESKVKYYAFGRELNTHINQDFSISLPIQYNIDEVPIIDGTCKYCEEGYVPDWQFITNYVRSLHFKLLTTKNVKGLAPKLKIDEWKPFRVSSILTIYNGKGITKEEIEENEGDFNVVQSGEENNGVLGKINKEYCKLMNYTLSEKPCLTVARSGSAGFVSFQSQGCVVGDSAKILLLDDNISTIGIYLFLQSILTKNRFKYAYGRKVTESKYMSDYVMLPAKYNLNKTVFIDETKKYSDEGYVPDWEFMESYIKSLPYGDRI